jgi:hypothetical protein
VTAGTGSSGEQLRIPLPLRAVPLGLAPPIVSLKGKGTGEAAFVLLREHGGLAGASQLARVLAEATKRPLQPSDIRAVLERDPRFARYGADLWGLRAVGMDGAIIRYAPSNGEIGQGVLTDISVTQPIFYGCPTRPDRISLLDEEDRRLADARGARLVTRQVLTGLRKWMQSVGFAYDGRSTIIITFVDFSEGTFRVAHQSRAEANEAMIKALGAEFAGIVSTLLRRQRAWVPIMDLLPQTLYLWPGKGAGPSEPFETVLRQRNGFRVSPAGAVRRAAGRSGPQPHACDYLLHFYEPATGRVRAAVKPSAPCPCGSGRPFGQCCRRAKPR